MIKTLYSQQDARWAKQELGFNSDPRFNIGNYGCVITSIGNMAYAITGDDKYRPDFINSWGKNNGGFASGGGLVLWDAYTKLGLFTAHGTTTNLVEVNQWLQPEANFAIVEFQLPGHQHYCLAPYVGMIIDSEDGNLKPMGTYPFLAAHLYTATLKPASSPTPPPVPVLSGTVTITAQPKLFLRTGPGTNFPLATGQDANGTPIQSLPNGAIVEYVNVVQGQAVNGNPNWYVSRRGNYFSAAYAK